MGVIKMEYVIRYSSQDDFFKAENLTEFHKQGLKPWLCSPNDKSGRIEAEFQLEQACSIEFIDIGNMGSSSVEIQVGKSALQQKTSYITYLPAVTLLTLADIKAGSAFNSVYMFNKGNINQLLYEKMWDRIKVVCSQPFKKQMQFGLTFLSLRTTKLHLKLFIGENPVDTSIERPSKLFPKKNTNYPSLEAVISRGAKMLCASKSRGFIQSRKSKFMDPLAKRLSPSQPISPQIVVSPQSPITRPSFREVVIDFLNAYNKEDKLTKAPGYYLDQFVAYCQQVLASHEEAVFTECYLQILSDNQQKYQRENDKVLEEKWKSENEISESMIKCFETFSEDPVQDEPKKMDHTYSNEEMPLQIIPIVDFIQPDGVEPSTSTGVIASSSAELRQDCPICGEYFPSKEIEIHASSCGELVPPVPAKRRSKTSPQSTDFDDQDNNVPCPLCMFSFPKDDLEEHIRNCSINKKFNSDIYKFLDN